VSAAAAPDVDDMALALATLGHGLAPHIRERARAHVERMQQRGDAAGCDPRLLELVVAEHLRPLPETRDWKNRHSRVRRRLHRDAQHDLPAADRDPVRLAADLRIASARSTWAWLRALGLAGHGEDDDLVTETLQRDLAADVSEVA
jgi:hypothetical protein